MNMETSCHENAYPPQWAKFRAVMAKQLTVQATFTGCDLSANGGSGLIALDDAIIELDSCTVSRNIRHGLDLRVRLHCCHASSHHASKASRRPLLHTSHMHLLAVTVCFWLLSRMVCGQRSGVRRVPPKPRPCSGTAGTGKGLRTIAHGRSALICTSHYPGQAW